LPVRRDPARGATPSGGSLSHLASYVALQRTGELDRRADVLEALLRRCTACPRRCLVDRSRDHGECGVGAAALVASWGPHFGEEPPISGRRGSGTVFLSGCNLRCRFCQNADISRATVDAGTGRTLDAAALADVMLQLQAEGCHNLNWVSPTHQVVALVRALAVAAARGLRIPVVYNTNAYDSLAVLRRLDGVVDVWMPDLKYADADVAQDLSGVPDYPVRARAAITEMFRQVGGRWWVDGDGVLRRGLLVRILVPPGGLAGEDESLRWLAETLSPDVAVSLMAQYRPAHLAGSPGSPPALARRLEPAEYRRALAALERTNRSPDTFVQPLL